MSFISKHSIPIFGWSSSTQQSIALIVLSAVIGVVVWWEYTGGNTNYPVQKFSQTPLPKVVAELDFTVAEGSWSGLQFDSQGNLLIDASTESVLVDAIAVIQEQHPGSQMARMALLLEKQFGAKASQQVMVLLLVIKDYKEMEQRWWEQYSSSDLTANKPPPHEELFQLQDELLGEELAERMFSEQRRLMTMMLANQQIRNDPNLTEAEKEQALMDLQKTFQDNVPDEPDL